MAACGGSKAPLLKRGGAVRHLTDGVVFRTTRGAATFARLHHARHLTDGVVFPGPAGRPASSSAATRRTRSPAARAS